MCNKVIFDLNRKILIMNKNTVFGWASFLMFLFGTALVLLGVLKYIDYAIGFTVVGIGFFTISWVFNALKGRL